MFQVPWVTVIPEPLSSSWKICLFSFLQCIGTLVNNHKFLWEVTRIFIASICAGSAGSLKWILPPLQLLNSGLRTRSDFFSGHTHQGSTYTSSLGIPWSDSQAIDRWCQGTMAATLPLLPSPATWLCRSGTLPSSGEPSFREVCPQHLGLVFGNVYYGS